MSHARALESLDAATLSVVRCVLACAALAVLWVEPSDPLRYSRLTYASLGAYLAYSIGISWLSSRKDWQFPPRWLHWADVAFYSYLLCVTDGTQSLFFFWFFFPLMVAAFAYGAREGYLVTAATTVAYFSLGLLATPWGEDFDLNLLLLRPAYLLVLGPMVAYWGGLELDLKRQLVLLHSLNELRNPRLGVDFTATEVLGRLCEHYGAERCLLLTLGPEGEVARCHSASGDESGDSVVRANLTRANLAPLIERIAASVLSFDGTSSVMWRKSRCVVWDVAAGLRRSLEPDHPWCRDIAQALGTACFLSVPYSQRDGTRGCMMVASGAPFDRSDAAFLLHFAAVFAMIVENTELVDELIASVSERERSRISLDIHDTTIQPYIGLRIALQGLYREIDEDSGLCHRVRELIEMADLTVADLRRYAEEIRGSAVRSGHVLSDAVKEQAERYERFYGLQVEVDIDGGSRLGSVASDIFHMVTEGLSNIRKHTNASKAYVRVVRDAIAVRIRIANETDDQTPVDFTPRSIEQRAHSLGGSVCVGVENGYTLVDISVPI